MLQVRAATEIHASPAAVWRVLTDLPRFRLWNPFIRAARGSTMKGGTVRVRVEALHFAARVTERCFHHLEAPVLRVTGFDIPYPPPMLERHHLPGPERVLDAVARLQWEG